MRTISNYRILLAVVIIIVIFATVYWDVDRNSKITQFNGIESKDKNDFHTKLYYSITTQSTVGYGDITPNSRLTRTLTSIQMLTTMLLVFYIASNR